MHHIPAATRRRRVPGSVLAGARLRSPASSRRFDRSDINRLRQGSFPSRVVLTTFCAGHPDILSLSMPEKDRPFCPPAAAFSSEAATRPDPIRPQDPTACPQRPPADRATVSPPLQKEGRPRPAVRRRANSSTTIPQRGLTWGKKEIFQAHAASHGSGAREGRKAAGGTSHE